MHHAYLIGLLSVLLIVPAKASVPSHVPVQGSLRDNAGQPVMEGAFRMRASLYASEDANEALWTHSWPQDQGVDCVIDPSKCVAVEAGRFRLSLPLDSTLFSAEHLWFGLQVEDEPELPRRPLGSTPYAYRAGQASALDCSGCVGSDALSPEALSTLASLAAAEVEVSPPSLHKVSQGVLTQGFVDTFTYPGIIAIPDNFPPGLSVSLQLADVGIAEALSVSVSVTNSDVSTLTLTLTDPEGGTHVLYDGASAGDTLSGTWPSPDGLVSGDLSAWVGKNPSGAWSLHVIDQGFLNNAQDGEISEWSIRVDTVSNTKLAANADLIVSGSVTVGGSDEDCTPARAGTVAFQPTSKSLLVCDGSDWLRLKTCNPECPQASSVSCGQGITSGCDDACPGTGSGLDPIACLGLVSATPCGQSVQDSCGNACGLSGTAPSAEACPESSEVACGDVISDTCGNLCSGVGAFCGAGSCLSGACCGDAITSGSEECDDGNQLDGDGCSAQCQNESVDYRGYVVWSQSCSNQSDALQDQTMNSACQSTYGADARAATIEEIYTGAINGLPNSNGSNQHLLGTCPDCEGNNDGSCQSGHCRKCVDPGASWPTSSNSGWNTNCCVSSRSAICVD